jgi:hypothetical protein
VSHETITFLVLAAVIEPDGDRFGDDWKLGLPPLALDGVVPAVRSF